MILRRNIASQTVAIGPFLDGSNQPIESGVSATVNESAASGTLTHTVGGCYTYTFTQGETANSIVRLRLSFSQRAICQTFATMALDASGQIVAQGVADIESLGLKVRYIQDQNGNAHEIAQSGNDDSVYELDLNSITASIIYPTVGTVAATANASYISIRTNEAITVTVALYDAAGTAVSTVGMTLELVFESGSTEVVIANADITKSATGFSFTVPSTLNIAERLWTYTCRKTTDEAVLCSGKLEVIYAPNN